MFGYIFLTACSLFLSLSQTYTTLQFSTKRKLRSRFGPQYPKPTIPMLIIIYTYQLFLTYFLSATFGSGTFFLNHEIYISNPFSISTCGLNFKPDCAFFILA